MLSRKYLKKLAREQSKDLLASASSSHHEAANDTNSILLPVINSIESDNDLPTVSIPFNNLNTFTTSVSSNTLTTNISQNYSTENDKKFIADLTSFALEAHLSRNHFNNLLELLRKYDKLDSNNAVKDCRTLLKSDYNKDSIVTMGAGEYFHFGISNGIVQILNFLNSTPTNILLSINVDGLPLFRSSSYQFWPILGSVSNITASKIPFPIGIYYGKSKPDTPKMFLRYFIDDLKSVMDNGVIYKETTVSVDLSFIICDAPAKSFILGVKGHNAYFGCTKCITEGNYINNRVTYPETNARLRTNLEFRNNSYEHDYHIRSTPLLEINFDVVKQVPLDYMHLVCLGVMKRMLLFWVRGKKNVRFNESVIENINATISKFRSTLTVEFARLPRSILEVEYWKATEFRIFLLYIGPLALRLIPKSYYLHFMLLHTAIRILATPHLCQTYNYLARNLLQKFVRNYGNLYGEEYISHNVHNLVHLVDDVIKFGCLDNFSSFMFENYMHTLKKKFQIGRRPLQQVVKKIYQEQLYFKSKKHVHFPVLNKLTNQQLIKSKVVSTYKSVAFERFQFITNKKDCYAILKNGHFVKILEISSCGVDIFFLATVFSKLQPFSYTDQMVDLQFGTISKDVCETKIIEPNDIAAKCIKYYNYGIALVHSE